MDWLARIARKVSSAALHPSTAAGRDARHPIPGAGPANDPPAGRRSAGDAVGYQLDLDPTVPVRKWLDGCEMAGELPTAAGTDGRMALRLGCGEAVRTADIRIGADVDIECELSIGLQCDAGAEGEIEVALLPDAPREAFGASVRLMSLPVRPGQLGASIAVPARVGSPLRIEVSRARSGSGAVHLQLLRLCHPLSAGKVNALASYAHRMRTEIANFSGNAYQHEMYGPDSSAAGSAGPVGSLREAIRAEADSFHGAMSNRIVARLSEARPAEGEHAFNFALRLLGTLLPIQPPNFFQRAKELSRNGPLKILSILSGAARIEEQLLAYCGDGVQITLVDASMDLIERAAARMASSHPAASVQCLAGDINDGLPGADSFDIILCVSALHHVANLELVLSQVNSRLTERGEFWSIGEQIGRNGNRLWPDALAAANAAFTRLPQRYRKNAHTGGIDEAISDRDFSISCFEGIRSEELEALLEAHLVPVDVYKRNAFLWRLVDATYGDNFDVSNAEDVEHLKSLVAAEALHWVAGGRSTELHGVYRKKFIVG